MMETGVVFKREEICRLYNISRNAFYVLARLPGSPLKKIEGAGWACEIEQMREFIREYQHASRTAAKK